MLPSVQDGYLHTDETSHLTRKDTSMEVTFVCLIMVVRIVGMLIRELR